MGCLNSEGQFSKWFSNIHLSGPCNRSCYFCIGQHMSAVETLNTLHTWPLPGIDKFKDEIDKRGIKEIYLTGTNTEPFLYDHIIELLQYFYESGDYTLGIRTNGIIPENKWDQIQLFDKMSVTICSLDPTIYKEMMGHGDPPDIERILCTFFMPTDLKVNIVLGPENTKNGDVFATIHKCSNMGVKRINLREPYGQPHVGYDWINVLPNRSHLGMPFWNLDGVEVTYWDVHYVEVESINLYANGYVSINYPITKGVDFDHGVVLDQSHFTRRNNGQIDT